MTDANTSDVNYKKIMRRLAVWYFTHFLKPVHCTLLPDFFVSGAFGKVNEKLTILPS
jgi:hypothetical protein